jgi:Mn-containing catalase
MSVKELIKYLLDNMYIDFQGEITLDTVRTFLREDDGRDARQLLSKLIEEKGVDDMLLTLADCLKEHIQSGINERVIREQISTYSES